MINNLPTLKTNVEKFLARDDLTDEISTFTALAASEITQALNYDLMELLFTQKPIDGQCSFYLPNGFLGLVDLRIDGTRYSYSPSEALMDNSSGSPQNVYTIQGQRLLFKPSAVDTIEMVYRGWVLGGGTGELRVSDLNSLLYREASDDDTEQIPDILGRYPLSHDNLYLPAVGVDDGDSEVSLETLAAIYSALDVLIELFPSLFLYKSLFHAYNYIQDEERAAYNLNLAERELPRAKRTLNKRAHGPDKHTIKPQRRL